MSLPVYYWFVVPGRGGGGGGGGGTAPLSTPGIGGGA